MRSPSHPHACLFRRRPTITILYKSSGSRSGRCGSLAWALTATCCRSSCAVRIVPSRCPNRAGIPSVICKLDCYGKSMSSLNGGRRMPVGQPHCTPQEGPLIDGLRGRLTSHDLRDDPLAGRAEGQALAVGVEAYHYFEGTKVPPGWSIPLWRVIATQRSIGSGVRCLSEAEIVHSVEGASPSARPHYGDGAYCTLHTDFAAARPPVVIAHGIDQETVRFRAVFRIMQPDRFRKFPATGGVTRSIPSAAQLERNQLVSVGDATGEIRLLRIERYEAPQWIRVSPVRGV